MDLQKKRSSTKKSKPSKTQIPLQMPLTPLIHEINQLKSELASIKSKKSLRTVKDLQQQLQRSSKIPIEVAPLKKQVKNEGLVNKSVERNTKENKLKQIVFPNKDDTLKMNNQFTKLYQMAQVQEMDHQKYLKQINKIIQGLNLRIGKLTEQQEEMEQMSHTPAHTWQKQAKIYQQLNNELEKQNIELRHLYAKQTDDFELLAQQNEQLRAQIDKISVHVIRGLELELEKMALNCSELRQGRQELEGKIRVYEKNIQKKQAEILMYEEDAIYCRTQCEKHVGQKRQIEKLFDQLQKQYKEMKCKTQIEIAALTKEKNKWKQDFEQKRLTQKQAQAQEDHKVQLRKQLQMLRREHNTQSDELSLIKIKLCQQQKKAATAEERNYFLRTENDKLLRSVDYCKAEIKQMSGQVEQLREQSQKYREMALKSKLGVKNTNKTQALQQIQDLIRQHKTNQAFSDQQ